MRKILSILLFGWSASLMQAQITIGGNVYGGGNQGNVKESTSVTIYAGDLNRVFGGAREADVGGSALVNIDGEHASNYILVNQVYGGNDISGSIGKSDALPSALTGEAKDNGVTKDWNAFVHISKSDQKIYIGQLFGGGNGDYDYDSQTLADKTNNPYYGKTAPALGRTYLELLGGSIVNAFGGGNKAKVTEKVVIYLNNQDKVVSSIKVKDGQIDEENGTELLVEDRFKLMGFNYKFTYPNSGSFQIGNLFGGNNKVDMAIRPEWHLLDGKVRNLYSGGNEGRMTNPEGLLLEIPANSKIVVDNVYGGCRRADVRPLHAETGTEEDVNNSDIQLSEGNYKFPAGFSARVLVRGGDINNVYGGNDISGNVYGGNAVGIYTSIRGDVYGGGNGSYSYTDNEELKEDLIWKDFYYNPGSKSSANALNEFRPNAEQISIRLVGTKEKPTIIGGSVYVGGNSATTKPQSLNPIANPQVHLKIGSYAMADNVFLGNNGEQMVDASDEGVLARYAGWVYMADGKTLKKFSTIDLTDDKQLSVYMEGCATWEIPSIVFDNTDNGDPANYEASSSTFGSIFCGGNVGSMILDGKTTINFNHKINVFNKVVGGCNNANVSEQEALVRTGTGVLEKQPVCADYEGGFLTPGSTGPVVGEATAIADKLELNMIGLNISPKRWIDSADKSKGLEWNTIDARTGEDVSPQEKSYGTINKDNAAWYVRLKGGNIYGGCYKSGHIDGNVVINLRGTVIDRENMFAKLETESDKLYGHDEYKITKNNSGVVLDLQGMDPLGSALNVFGGGYGEDSEIWGSTTINLTQGYTFQIYGGGEQGAVGRGARNSDGKLEYTTYDPRFSTYINLDGTKAGVERTATTDPIMAEAEFIYGGGFEGTIMGDTHVYLGNGRLFNSFAGSCNADIVGHTETYIGLNKDGKSGFPYVRDHIYGGNDLGGHILREVDFSTRVREDLTGIKSGIYDNGNTTKAAAYLEYRRGRVDHIFGGCYGDYDYTDTALYGDYINADGTDKEGFTKPHMVNAFVNFRPDDSKDIGSSRVNRVFGAGQGHTDGVGINEMQERSYVLIDIPQEIINFEEMEVFGSGAWGGLGMGVSLAGDSPDYNTASAIIDLFRGTVKNVYGASYNEGVTRRTVVNVPAISTISIKNIFGGGYGSTNVLPCDAYEANVNYYSKDAKVTGALYGGNNHARRTLYGKVNVYAPVYSDKDKGYTATVYGAGLGEDTWSQYTEVNLENGASVYEAYGGGQMGKVMNTVSVMEWAKEEKKEGTEPKLDLGNGYQDDGLKNPLVTATKLGGKYNCNVHINEGATIGGYCYGGGLGTLAVDNSGDVYGTTYIDLLGGRVTKDLYAAGTSGSVMNRYGIEKDDFGNDFIASSTAYIKGGTARNVYGGGWEGSVGRHQGEKLTRTDSKGEVEFYYDYLTPTENDIAGETHVIIGDLDGKSFTDGIPAIQRNAYGGGEGGAVFGTAHLTLNKGYIGYVYNADGTDDPATVDMDERYEEKIHDETWTDHVGANRLYDSGCVFGGGYVDNSSVDNTEVTMWNGHVRNSLFGGGEIAAIGRGKTELGKTNADRKLDKIYKAGSTSVTMYDGYVGRDVFGGGRGYNNLGEKGTLYSDGFVFGKTLVSIHGGEIGTAEGVAQGYGNVFGGGDIGYVYSAYEEEQGKDGTKTIVLGQGKSSGSRYDGEDEGYYYKSIDGKFTTDGDEKIMTEDCKVLIEPWCKVKTPVTIGDKTYAKGDFVGIDALNLLGTKTDARWGDLDEKGIIVHNAVFAGGNTSTGSDEVYANTTTVFGNATASIHDVYHRDLITIGTGHTGGLYGDGNLTLVDGYRGLNITNYGTDYYSIKKEITLEEFESLPEREAAYYELRYKCVKECTDNEGTVYHPESTEDGRTINASTITTDELLTLFKDVKIGDNDDMLDADGKPNADYWVENGVCSRYAGRIMNTIQRADFCGVFGSRMVMQGAEDRVPETVDHTKYTINRVREVSLNKRESDITGDAKTDKAYHGNYFGIYNIVNFLGGLTSDVDFGDGDETSGAVRTSDNTDKAKYGPDMEEQTFYDWKKKHIAEQKRNNGNSYNQVALASGVYLELTSEKSTGTGLREKDWGYITGVIELDLINVQTGIGGGFVYAKNEHGVRRKTNKKHVTLTLLNKGAATMADYEYAQEDSNKEEWQTSGNFVHSTQIIIDDCYNISGKYKSDDFVPAHYWYIKGQVYVYDQYVSAYTGAPNAYSEKVNIPLTITAASHGTMKLLDVKSNLFAFYATNNGGNRQELKDGQKLVINEVEYEKNAPISYWDWKLLAKSEQLLFESETYIVVSDCKIGGKDYTAGTVLKSESADSLAASGAGNTKPTVTQMKMVDGEEKEVEVDFDFVVRSSNNMSHDTGFILTYQVNNPTEWDMWHTPVSASYTEKIPQAEYEKKTVADQKTYENGPTYRLTSKDGGVFGQREYKVSSVIAKSVYDTYQAILNDNTKKQALKEGQATFAPAYIVTEEIEKATMKDGTTQHLFPGARLAATDYSEAQWKAIEGSVAEAYLCTSTIQLTKTENIYSGTLLTKKEIEQYKADYPDVATHIADLLDSRAYYCTEEGLYGGNYYEPNRNYRGLEVWCSMSDNDRKNFQFNYDALDLLIDPTYQGAEGQKYQYDGSPDDPSKRVYSAIQAVDYTATFKGDSLNLGTSIDVKRSGSTITTKQVLSGDEISRTAYESLPNEKRHFAPIKVSAAGDYYVVNQSFQHGETPYAVGQVVELSTYEALGADKQNVTKLTFDALSDADGSTYYFCRESYEIGTAGTPITSAVGVAGATPYDGSGSVRVGVVIDEAEYKALLNQQLNFTIHGIAPVETTTLYVSRNSDINDLSTEKIITVIYQYDYEESDEAGLHITPISERHVVNIHIRFKSGVPTLEDISAPKIVLPGTSISILTPDITPGAYEVTGGGWELFRKKSDAESHVNGVEYTPTRDALYWYQNDYYLAYYALTYLGKTYSNDVKISVANYHDLAAVMNDKQHHYYIDHDDVEREPKIYINDYTTNDPATSKSGIDLFRQLISLSHVENNDKETGLPTAISGGELDGHMPLDLTHTTGVSPKPMRGGEYLEFFLRSDQDVSGSAWTPVANGDGECFRGVLHGDGHTVSGLSGSLFNHLCGDVYNLGVTGSFTGAGIAEDGVGYLENCWVYNSSTEAKTSKPVFGSPTIEEGDQSERPVRMVNCYYMEEDDATSKYENHTGTYGIPTRKPARAFHNGEVAYDLNGFYLNKRYYDGTNLSGGSSYQYFKVNDDGSLPDAPATACYPATPDAKYGNLGYVENRLKDGDFIYAGGEIPDGSDVRLYTDKDGNSEYDAIWPDDYMFFGQMLTYGYADNRPYQPLPSHINKSGNRLTTTPTNINRVYRAPAYFRSSDMGVAHYNPYAIFASQSADKTYPVYPDMTAIDFTGTNDGNYQLGLGSVGRTGATTQGFYPPLLDIDGLTYFRNVDLTRNLLAYTPAPTEMTGTASSKTYRAVETALSEPVYSETHPTYRTVAVQDDASVYGHQVVRRGSGFEARSDHFLVDKEEFYAPLAYDFTDDQRMFYQRTPSAYVDRTKGWEGISLPFGVELVTAQGITEGDTKSKGEITHFYSGSSSSDNDTGSKLGHEYWLRGFKGHLQQKKDENDADIDGVFTADFNYPDAGNEGDKEYTNTFLWDYYYLAGSQLDRNTDRYQEYYRSAHTFKDYGYAEAAKPYIIGFPGATYYEFDLSGNWEARWTKGEPGILPTQVITFASWPNAHINASDQDTGDTTEEDGYNYNFRTNYLKQSFAAGTADTYTLNAEGSGYGIVPTDAPAEVLPFRPYFTRVAKTASPAGGTRSVSQIVFGQGDAQFGVEEHGDPSQEQLNGGLDIHAKKQWVVVESSLNYAVDIRIVNTAGVTVRQFEVGPGETVRERVNYPGMYIVHSTDGLYTKKVTVKR